VVSFYFVSTEIKLEFQKFVFIVKNKSKNTHKNFIVSKACFFKFSSTLLL